MTSLDKTSELIAQLDARLERVEEVIAVIGHNAGPPLDDDPPAEDRRLTTSMVEHRYGVTRRSVDRWLSGTLADFPRPEVINGRKYWRELRLRAWDRSRVLQSMKGTK